MFVDITATRMQVKIIVANTSLKDVTEFRYLGLTVINQNYVFKEIKNILKLEYTCHLSFHTILSLFSSENVEIKIHKTILLCVVLYEYGS